MVLAITGGSGFVGREIVHQAVSRGQHVRALTRRAAARLAGVDVFPGDVVTGAGLREAFTGADVVIHAAGLAHQHVAGEQADFARTNGQGCGNVVRAARQCGVARVVLLSSVSVYGGSRSSQTVDETYQPRPVGNYARSKLAGERAAISEANGVVGVHILRLATVFGAGDPGNFARLINAIRRRRFIRVGNGMAQKSIIHRRDAARACLTAAATESTTIRCCNVVGGVYNTDYIVSAIAALVATPVAPLRIPSSIATIAATLLHTVPGVPRRIANSLDRWQRNEAYSGAAFECEYGFQPTVSLDEGLAEEVAWYLAESPDPHR